MLKEVLRVAERGSEDCNSCKHTRSLVHCSHKLLLGFSEPHAHSIRRTPVRLRGTPKHFCPVVGINPLPEAGGREKKKDFRLQRIQETPRPTVGPPKRATAKQQQSKIPRTSNHRKKQRQKKTLKKSKPKKNTKTKPNTMPRSSP